MHHGAGEARHWYDTAVLAEQRGDRVAAIAALEQAVARDPSQAGWHHQLGRWRLRQRRWREAVAAFEAAWRLEPERAARYYWLGRGRERCWDFDGAHAAYTEAVRRAPSRQKWAARLARVAQLREQFRPYSGMVIAHRGRCGDLAENAVESLSALPGHIAGVEVDVRCSRDGVPVLMHDPTVDRTTDGQGRVADLSYRQLRQLQGVAGARVPSLESYLEACRAFPLRLIVLDLKEPRGVTLDTILTVVTRSPVADRCVVMVRDAQEMANVRARDPEIRLGCFGVTEENVAERIAAAREYRAEVLLTMFGSRRYLANRGVVARIRSAGLRAGASTINSWSALDAARVDECDLFLTDVGEQLDRFVGAAGR
ncbi:MAG TPA: glycerophosphodiester phosphodiesterase family protein [Natronosporangium sp.]|nr:glycerophosphodiester phosphodiesterase family protein [Natronosporangium sp.]